MKEVWEDVKGYEGLYQVSSLGRVKSLNYRNTGQERFMRLTPDKDGYLDVILCKDGKMKHHKVHRLVAQTFISNPDSKPCLDHINSIRTDNTVDNLCWVTHRENSNNPITKEHNTRSATKKVFCENAVYDSITQCAEHYNINRPTMNKWLTGTCKMPANFQVRGLRYYIEEKGN